nr:hypothetical protein HK105_006427 [Polyrhizophydium stewartii]
MMHYEPPVPVCPPMGEKRPAVAGAIKAARPAAMALGRPAAIAVGRPAVGSQAVAAPAPARSKAFETLHARALVPAVRLPPEDALLLRHMKQHHGGDAPGGKGKDHVDPVLFIKRRRIHGADA